MGNTIQKKCTKCGYTKNFLIGTGLNSLNIKTVRKIFPAEQLIDFEAYMNSCSKPYFLITQDIFYCEHCRDYKSTAILKYRTPSQFPNQIIQTCNDCGSILQSVEDLNHCPKCGELLTTKDIGIWD